MISERIFQNLKGYLIAFLALFVSMLIFSGAIADPYYTPNEGKYPLDVQFTLPGGAACDGVKWDFGDDTSGETVNPLHTYQRMGIFYPALVCTLPGGTVSYEFDKITSRNANFPDSDTYDYHYPYSTVVNVRTDTLSAEELRRQGRALDGLGQYEYAADSYRQLVAQSGSSDAGILAEYARVLFRLSRWNDAKSVLEQLVAIQPDPDTLGMYGAVLLRMNQFAGAQDAYNRSLQMNDANAGAWAGFASASASLNQTGTAMAAYKKSVALDGNQASVWIQYGDLLSSRGANPEAAQAYDNAAALGMTGSGNWNKYSNLLRKVGRNQDALNAQIEARNQ